MTESVWRRFIRNLNPPKAARDVTMIAALNAALAGGMVSFMQTVPPDIKTAMVIRTHCNNLFYVVGSQGSASTFIAITKFYALNFISQIINSSW